MADEITISAQLKVLNGTLDHRFGPLSMTIDMSGTDAVRQTQTVGTSAEALDIGDLTTPGYILIVNRDDTNYVEVRDGSGGADVVKLEAGEFALFRLATTTPYVIADTDSCVIEYLLLED